MIGFALNIILSVILFGIVAGAALFIYGLLKALGLR